MDKSVNFNQNISECLKAINNFGETIYQNVCNGATHSVPWGTIDYIEAGAITLMAIACVGLLAFIGWVVASS